MDGIESTRAIRDYLTNKRKLPRDQQPVIVSLTGHVSDAYKNEGIKAGMDDMLPKPIYQKVLKQLLVKHFDGL